MIRNKIKIVFIFMILLPFNHVFSQQKTPSKEQILSWICEKMELYGYGEFDCDREWCIKVLNDLHFETRSIKRALVNVSEINVKIACYEVYDGYKNHDHSKKYSDDEEDDKWYKRKGTRYTNNWISDVTIPINKIKNVYLKGGNSIIFETSGRVIERWFSNVIFENLAEEAWRGNIEFKKKEGKDNNSFSSFTFYINFEKEPNLKDKFQKACNDLNKYLNSSELY
jgi:hypothetical protein